MLPTCERGMAKRVRRRVRQRGLHALLGIFLIGSGLALPEEFHCGRQSPSAHASRDASEVRFADVRAVAALGDSISAGFGMRHRTGFWVDDAVEFRGLAFSAGGDGGETLPALLEAVRPVDEPPLAGPSHSTTLPLDFLTFRNHVLRKHKPETDHFNAAMSGSYVDDIVKKQIPYLVDQMRRHPWLDVDKDWKVISVETGANNLLDACLNQSWSNPEHFRTELKRVLREVKSQIPFSFVNLMPIVNISAVHKVGTLFFAFPPVPLEWLPGMNVMR